MNAARVCPTPLLDATPSTIDGFLSGRYQFAIAPSRPQFRTTRCCHSSPRPIVGPRQRGLPHAAEFHRVLAVATRPVEGNGFGWTSERTAKEVADLQERFPILPDSPEVFARWLDLVQRFPVRGKRVHDARLVAVLQAHAIEHLVSFNTPDFAAFSFLSLIDPQQLISTTRE